MLITERIKSPRENCLAMILIKYAFDFDNGKYRGKEKVLQKKAINCPTLFIKPKAKASPQK